MRTTIEYGDGHLEVAIPESSTVVRAERATHEPPPLDDPWTATRTALRQPLGSEPLAGLVGPGSKVTIAFPDRVKGGAHETAHRRVALPLILDELAGAGVKPEDIRLICAIGLHRKNRREEIAGYLGADILTRLPEANIENHDAEDPTMADLGRSSLGDPVQVNRAVIDADLTVLIGHTAGNPYGGYSGGYKMPATGLVSWRSIAAHHSPGSLYRDDFVPASTESRFRDQLRAIGQGMEAHMPQPFFSVDAVLDSSSRQLGVFAGRIPEVEQASWPLAGRRTGWDLDMEPADVLLVGVPRNFHYGNGMGSNPILMMQALGASITRARSALVEHPVIIGAAVCDGWFNDDEFPAYREAYDALQLCNHPSEMPRFEDKISTNHEWVYRYRHRYGYHPFHAFSMIYMGGIALSLARAVYIAGARKPGFARGMGARTTATVEEALAETAAVLGRQPRVLVIPELTKPAFHVRAARA